MGWGLWYVGVGVNGIKGELGVAVSSDSGSDAMYHVGLDVPSYAGPKDGPP